MDKVNKDLLKFLILAQVQENALFLLIKLIQ